MSAEIFSAADRLAMASCLERLVLKFNSFSAFSMDNGQSLALPRTGAADFKKAWGSYWLDACDTSTDC